MQTAVATTKDGVRRRDWWTAYAAVLAAALLCRELAEERTSENTVPATSSLRACHSPTQLICFADAALIDGVMHRVMRFLPVNGFVSRRMDHCLSLADF